MSASTARPTRAPKARPGLARPQSDGRRVLFEVLVDGQPVSCAIAQHALRDLVTGGKRTSPGDLMHCFDTARPQIEALALRKIRARRAMPQGVLYIWPDDIEDETPTP